MSSPEAAKEDALAAHGPPLVGDAITTRQAVARLRADYALVVSPSSVANACRRYRLRITAEATAPEEPADSTFAPRPSECKCGWLISNPQARRGGVTLLIDGDPANIRQLAAYFDPASRGDPEVRSERRGRRVQYSDRRRTHRRDPARHAQHDPGAVTPAIPDPAAPNARSDGLV